MADKVDMMWAEVEDKIIQTDKNVVLQVTQSVFNTKCNHMACISVK